MKTEYRRDLHHNYVVLSGEAEETEQDYRIHMLTDNSIEGLLACHTERMDNRLHFCYEVSSKVSLKTILEVRSVQKELLVRILHALWKEIEILQNYLLPEDGLLLSPELIFTDAQQSALWFCYYPIDGEEELLFQKQLLFLGEELLMHLDHKDSESVVLGYAFYQRTTAPEQFEAADFQELLDSCKPREAVRHPDLTEQERLEHEQILDSFFTDEDEMERGHRKRRGWGLLRKLLVWLHLRPAEDTQPEDSLVEEPKESVAETVDVPRPASLTGERLTVQGPDGEEGEKETVFLGDLTSRAFTQQSFGREVRAELVPVPETNGSGTLGAQPKLVLTKEHYLIGKSRAAADLVISDPAISRVHAKLSWNGMTYELEDLNSKNGTSVNGKRLEGGCAEALSNGDCVRLAAVTYQFVQKSR